MPCNQVIRQSIDFALGKNTLTDLARALEELGYAVTVGANSLSFHDRYWRRGSFKNGKFNVVNGFDIDAVKREFSKQIVKSTAKQYGWELIMGKDGKTAELVKKVI